MAKQSTVKINKGALDAKFKRAEELFGEKVEEKLVSLGSYAVQISPVDTGAYVSSFSIRPRGSSSGRRRTSEGKPSLTTGAKQGAKDSAKAALQQDVERFRDDILDREGAVLTNRSPHAQDVEQDHLVFSRTKDRFR